MALLLLPFSVFSRPHLRGAAGQMGEKNSHWHAAEHRRGCRKEDLHCLRRSRVCKAPAARGAQGIPPTAGQVTGVPFSCFFFWARKRRKRNKKGGRSFLCRPKHSLHLNNYQPAAINRSISSLPMVSFSNKSLAIASKIARFSLSSRVAVSLASVTSPVTA